MSSAHESIKSARKSVRKDLELRWVTNLREERKTIYLIATLLDPRTKMMSFCDNQYVSSRGKTRVTHFFQWTSKVFIWHINGCRPVLCQRGDRIKCIHASAAGGHGHRPSHVVEAAPARVPTLGPHDQAVPDCACQFFVS